MRTNRLDFLTTSLAGGVLPSIYRTSAHNIDERYEKLDKAALLPVFKTHRFPDPVKIENVDLLEYKGDYLCRVRSKDGVQGFSFGTVN